MACTAAARIRRHQRAVPIALLAALGTAGCAASTPTPPPVTVTVEAPAPETSTKAQAPAKETTAAQPEPAAVEEEATFEMPALVGVNLQLAQDTLQALGSYVMDQQDASGLGRFQVNDSNWVVCAQDPVPGSVVTASSLVTLASVKLDETCP